MNGTQVDREIYLDDCLIYWQVTALLGCHDKDLAKAEILLYSDCWSQVKNEEDQGKRTY